MVRISVPRRGRWRAWLPLSGRFEQELTAQGARRSSAPRSSLRPVAGRSARVRAAVLRATLDALLACGADDLSIRDVAQRAGVHETSIYRRWGTRANLILNAVLSEIQAAVPAPDTGSLRGDLVALLSAIAAFVTTQVGQLLLRLALRDDLPEDHDARERFWAERFTTGQTVLQRAQARGELRPCRCRKPVPPGRMLR